MPIELKNVIPWGRSYSEYRKMFNLQENELASGIIGCGDGPASFNAEMHEKGYAVVSIDPVYAFSKEQIEQRIIAAKEDLLQQVYRNIENYNWEKEIKNPEELFNLRLGIMRKFLDDYEEGRMEGRYLPYSLPTLPLKDHSFGLALCSYLLFAFPGLGLEFHIQSIREMLRVAGEARIFPIVDLNGRKVGFFEQALEKLRGYGYAIQVMRNSYTFLKNATEMLVIRSK